MVRLSWLKISKYRSVEPTSLSFAPGINVVLGQNGTGKTTLLNLVAQLVKGDFSGLAKEPIEVEYELSLDDVIMVVRVASVLSEVPPRGVSVLPPDVTVKVAQAADVPRLLYEISISPAGSTSTSFRFDGNKLFARMDGEEEKELMTRNMSFGPHSLLAALMALAPGEKGIVLREGRSVVVLGAETRLDESLLFLGRVTTDNHISFVASEPEVKAFDMQSSRPMPAELFARFFQKVNTDSHVDCLEARSDEVSFLARLVGQLGFSSGRAFIDRRECTVVDGRETIRFGDLRFEFTRIDGSVVSHDMLSYGQKRLLALYYYIACEMRVVIVDELVNGLHRKWIQACLDEIGGRQAVLTSQNPLLFDYLTLESSEAVEKTFLCCSSTMSQDGERWRWRNLSPDEAASVFDAYEVGIQQVSEILEQRGLG